MKQPKIDSDLKLTNGFYLYKFLNKDNIVLYVGRTVNLFNLFKQHEHLTDDVTTIQYCVCKSKADMHWKEIYYINYYYNPLMQNTSEVCGDSVTEIRLQDKWIDYPFSKIKEIIDTSKESVEEEYNKYVINVPQLDYKSLISIYNDKRSKMNRIGSDRNAISKIWFKNNPSQVLQLKKNLTNFFRNINSVKTHECLWTTYEDARNVVKTKGYIKSYVHPNEPISDKYYHVQTIAYICNQFYSGTKNTSYYNLTEDQYALTNLMKFLWRSALSQGKEINIYIPSSRMRKLLENWIDEQCKNTES